MLAAPPSFRLLTTARCNQVVEHSSENEKVLGGSKKLGGAAKHLVEGLNEVMAFTANS